jgi:hypothetical protein
MLTNRDIASILWSALFIGIIWWRLPDTRESVVRLVKLAFSRVFVIVALVLLMWTIGVVLVASQLGLWNLGMVKDTIVAAIPGLALLLASTHVASEPGFYRKRLRAAIGGTILVEFFVGLATYDFLPEFLLIVPLASAVSLTLSLAESQELLRPLKRPAGVIAAILGMALLGPPIAHLVTDWGSIDATQTLRDLLLPIWLTSLSVIPAFGFSVFLVYEEAFSQMRWRGKIKRVPWRAKVALVTTFHIRPQALNRFAHAGTWPDNLVRATSIRDCLRIARAGDRALKGRR